MLKIRLQRVGRKNDPSFRIVLVDSHEGPKTGNHIEVLGAYNPRTEERRIDGERITHWIGKGAQVSPTLWNMLITAGVVSGKKINVLPRKSPIQKESAAAPGGDTSAALAGNAPEEASGPETAEAPEVREEVPAATGEEKPQEPAEEALDAAEQKAEQPAETEK